MRIGIFVLLVNIAVLALANFILIIINPTRLNSNAISILFEDFYEEFSNHNLKDFEVKIKRMIYISVIFNVLSVILLILEIIFFLHVMQIFISALCLLAWIYLLFLAYTKLLIIRKGLKNDN